VSVYFISARQVGLVKIGCAFDAFRRFRHLQTSSPVELTLEGAIPGDFEKERELHVKYAALRVRGEWFTINDEIEAEIAASTKPRVMTQAAARVWRNKLTRKEPARFQPGELPREREKRLHDEYLVRAREAGSRFLTKLEAGGEIHFPFRDPTELENA
jgi:hypothetical protein